MDLPGHWHYSSVVSMLKTKPQSRKNYGKLLLAAILVCAASSAAAQSHFTERLPENILDIDPPSSRVAGHPGDMVYVERACPSLPLQTSRSRIVNAAVQEWAYFGFSVLDLVPTRDSNPDYQPRPWRRTLVAPDEARRVADSIAGYWATTPNSLWILERQNQSWESRGVGSRWRNPWSAAFISWVMCESGLGNPEVFQRAIAHHSYIDQAILATENNHPTAAYKAIAPGEQEILPGDLLCRGARPAYRSIEARREQIGEGARTHCDIVVKLDPANERIMLIGGNVKSWVRLKLLPASISAAGHLAPVPYDRRQIFAHLKLQADPVTNTVFEDSPTLQTVSCERHASSLAMIRGSLAIDCGEDSRSERSEYERSD